MLLLSGSTVTVSGGDTAFAAQGKLTLSAGNVTVLTARRGITAGDMTVSGGSLSISAVEQGLVLSDDIQSEEAVSAPYVRRLTVTDGLLSLRCGGNAHERRLGIVCRRAADLVCRIHAGSKFKAHFNSPLRTKSVNSPLSRMTLRIGNAMQETVQRLLNILLSEQNAASPQSNPSTFKPCGTFSSAEQRLSARATQRPAPMPEAGT